MRLVLPNSQHRAVATPSQRVRARPNRWTMFAQLGLKVAGDEPDRAVLAK